MSGQNEIPGLPLASDSELVVIGHAKVECIWESWIPAGNSIGMEIRGRSFQYRCWYYTRREMGFSRARLHDVIHLAVWTRTSLDTGGVKDGCGFEMDGSRRESLCADFSMVESWDGQ